MGEDPMPTIAPLVTSLMPGSLPDLIWIWASGVTVLLLGLVVYYLREMRMEQKEANKSVTQMLINQSTIKTELHDHISNDGVHCKGYDCPAFDRRLTPRD